MPTGIPFWTGAGSVINLTAQGAISTTGFANLPAAADNPRVIAFVPDVGQGGSMWFSDGTVWRPVSRRIPLHAANYGANGLTLAPNSAEQFIAPEVTIPGGVVRPGDVLWFMFYAEVSATGDSGTKAWRYRAKEGTGVTLSDAALATLSTTNNTNSGFSAAYSNFVVSSTIRRSVNNFSVGTGTATNATIPSVDSAFSIRPTMQNSATTASLTIYYVSLWLERSGL